jgi:hypothetical protein
MEQGHAVDTTGMHTTTKRGRRAAMTRVCALVIAVAVPAAASGQPSWSSAIDDVRETARVHVGPIYATPALQLKELGVDGNVFNSDGDQRSDFTVSLGPRADIWLPVARRALLQATVAADLVWYAQYEAERSIDPERAFRGELYLHRVMLFGRSANVNTRQRPNHEIDVRSRHVDDSLSAGLGVALTPDFTVEIAASQTKTRYDADAVFDDTSLQRTLNRETRGLELRARHQITPLTGIGLRYDRLRDEFTFSPIRNSNSYRVMPGIEFKPRALVNGSAYIGYRRFTPSEPGSLQDFGGLVAQLGMSYTLLGATTFGVSYRRDLAYSYEELQPFFVDQSVGASVRRAIGRRFDALVSADRHTYEYRDLITSAPPEGGARRIDAIWNYAASIGYRVGADGRIAFGASYWQRESTTKRFRDYDNLRVGSSMSFGF